MLENEVYLNNLWEQTLNLVVESNQVEKSSLPYFESKLINFDNEVAVVKATNFVNYTIMIPYIEVLEDCLAEILHKRLHIKLISSQEQDDNIIHNNEVLNDFITKSVDPSQTFANFVVGKSNVQAHLAAMTCASNMAAIYNPLFIYGNPGLGKTHLLNAIGNQVKALYPDKKVGFVTGQEFLEGVKNAAKSNRYDEFKRVYQGLDLLLIDDIQNIAAREKTDELFFTIYNELINNRKQVCITSDRSPNDIKNLSDRIISRFNQGLNVNIEAPEYETSINILKMKLANSSSPIQPNIDDDVLSYLATNFSQDVRSLEGAINRLLFYSACFPDKYDKDHITLQLAVDAFKDLIQENKNELAISTVRKAVCDYYNLTKQQITSANRTKNISTARQIAMYLCRKLLDATYDDIGKEFGGRDHSTVMSSCDNIERKIKTDPLYLKAINEIESRIR